MLFHFIINSKNYPEASGEKSLAMAGAVQESQSVPEIRGKISLYLAIPAFSISEISNRYPSLSILAQHLDDSNSGNTTGHLAPEIAKACGAKGTILNHSEHRISKNEIRNLVKTLHELSLTSVVCARDAAEVGEFATYEPDFIAIEPPELIGSGKAVSRFKPELIADSESSLKRATRTGQSTILLCGAGIVDKDDVKRAVELGAKGILVASSVVKAEDWSQKIISLASGFEF